MNYALDRLPEVTFRTRVRDESVEGPNPFRWQDVKTSYIFNGRSILLFALPGAFTPTCSNSQLPGYENLYGEFMNYVDDIYCLSVNDAFVMYQWAQHQGIKDVKMLPDGSGEFTRKMGMLVEKNNLGFGFRSWRYALWADDGVVRKMWVEPGFCDNAEDDPYGQSSPENVLKWFKERESFMDLGPQVQPM